MKFIKKYWFFIFAISIFFLTYDPIERIWKLKSNQKENRLKNLEMAESIINKCKRLNTRYSKSNDFDKWVEILEYPYTNQGIENLFTPYAYPIIKVYFDGEQNVDNSICKVRIGYKTPIYEFYKYVYFDELGRSVKWFCDDWGDNGRACY